MSDSVNSRQEAQPRLRILLADDSKVIRTSAARILADEFDILLAVDGQDAWDQLNQNRDISAVFTDLEMPYLNGMALLQRIRESEDDSIKVTPVIILTGDETDETREDALSKGATDFITKPFNRVALLARARSHAKAVQERRELEAHTTIDRLTRLGNEQHFMERLRDARSFSERHGQPFSMIRVEVDELKPLVKEIGKEQFLKRLRDVGSLIRACIRNEDTAARIDTVHFGVILPVCDHEGARRLAERVQKSMQVGFHKAGWPKPMTVSVGISTPSLFPEAEFDQVLADLAAAASAAASEKSGGIAYSAATSKRLKAGEVRPPMDTVAALRALSEGQDEAVLKQLPQLLQKLAPLIRLAAKHQADLFKRILKGENK